eukprot:4006976-Alexandrium_andersonii.AAC.1
MHGGLRIEPDWSPDSKEDTGANAKVPLCTQGARGTWNMQNCSGVQTLNCADPGKTSKVVPEAPE